MQKKYRKALVIGRFQPFHKGHLYLIQEALTIAEKVIIGIGSANVSNMDNPYSAAERLEMIKRGLKKNNMSHDIERIVMIDDHPSDEVWLQLVLQQVPEFDVVLGNNDWVNGIFKQAGFNVLEIPFYKRHIYEGKKIRAKLRQLNRL